MAFKSEAQRRKFQEMLKAGKITKAVYDAFAGDTPSTLPERTGKPDHRGQVQAKKGKRCAKA